MEGIRDSFEAAEDIEHGVGGLAGMKKLGMHATELWIKLAFPRVMGRKSSAALPRKGQSS